MNLSGPGSRRYVGFRDRRAGAPGTRVALLLMTISAALLLNSAAGFLPARIAPSSPVGSSPLASVSGALPLHHASSTSLRSTPSPTATGSSATPYWTNLTVASAPPPGLQIVNDSADGYLLGYQLTSAWLPTGATWTYRNGSWVNVSATAGSPPLWSGPERSFELAFDPVDGYVLAIAGANSTWSFHGGRWTELTPTCTGLKGLAIKCPAWGRFYPPGHGQEALAYDAADGYVLLVGYTVVGFTTSWNLWKYAQNAWSLICPHSTSSLALCYSWGTNAPGPRTYTGMVFDENQGGILLFGGFTATSPSGPTNDSWRYTGGNWTNLNLTGSPPARSSFALAYDPADGATLLFGGYGVTASGSSRLDTDTWAFASGSWVNLTGGIAPADAGTAAIVLSAAYDPVDQGVLLVAASGPDLRSGTDTWYWGKTPPIAALAISATPPSADAGTSVAFQAVAVAGTPPLSYQWAFGDGAYGIGPSPTHGYPSPGNYTVLLQVVDAAGHGANAGLAMTVVRPVSAHPAATPNPTDVGLPTAFTPGTSGGTSNRSYLWALGEGALDPSADPIHAYTRTGSYPVELWVTDSGGGRNQSNLLVLVNPRLAVSLTASPITPWLGEVVNFSAAVSGGTPGYTFSWTFGDGGIGGNLRTISHIFTTNGPINATVSVLDGARALAQATLHLTVALNLTVLANWTLGAAPLEVGFTSHVQGGSPGYTFAWGFGDGASSSTSSPVHTYDTPGSFNAVLVVTDAEGHRAQATWNLFVAPGGGPLSIAVSGNPVSVAIGGYSILTASVFGGIGGYTMSWQPGGASCVSSGLLTERCSGSLAGNYTVRVAAIDSAGHSAEAATTLSVGSLGPTNGSHVKPQGFLEDLARDWPWVAGGAGAAAVAVALLFVSRRKGGRRGDRGAAGDFYAAYLPRRAPPTDPVAPRRPANGPNGRPPPPPEESEVDPLAQLL